MNIRSVLARGVVGLFFTGLFYSASSFADEGGIDASDPTKIYTFAGVGLKYTSYTNGDSMKELRATGNIGLSANDMLLFEFGYGKHSGNRVRGDDTDLTNARLRWFHLFPMEDVTTGYRGMGTQVDLQIAGKLKGTDGQNVLSVGPLTAFGINENWSFYLPLSLVSSWDKNFKEHNGYGVNVAPLFVYAPPNWWEGAYLQIWPAYTRFVSGSLDGEGAGNFDLVLGGNITDTVLWSLYGQKHVDKDLKQFRRGRDTGLKTDWSVFFSITTYF